MPLLDIQNLCASFRAGRGSLRALDGVSLSVECGEFLGLVGESGCGKSVTAQSVLRLYDEKRLVSYSGSVIFGGRDILRMPLRDMRRYRGARIALAFQNAQSALNPVFTAGSQIAESLRLHRKLPRKAAREQAVKLLRLVGIPDPERRAAQFPHQLSGGMRQRAMLAVALACSPELLIADEPTTALDATVQAQIMELLAELNTRLGMSVLLITHDLAVVAETCSRVAVMYLGQIAEEAPVRELFGKPLHPYTLGLLNSLPRMSGTRGERLRAIPGAVPPLGQIPDGCRFQNRCPLAEGRCRTERQELRASGMSGCHKVRCWKTALGAGGTA
jgi:oligopeptide/dipeptide ABC transporter ATP-binding protein